MRLRYRSRPRLCYALLAFEAGPELAHAAQAAKADSAPEVITVTKVKQNVRKVPFSVSVISGKKLQQQHVQSVAELTRQVPDLSFSTQGGEGNQNLEIRGISSTDGQSIVAAYIDDVPITVRNLNAQGQAEPRFFDISRIEVLRRPQGTPAKRQSRLRAAAAYRGPLRLDELLRC